LLDWFDQHRRDLPWRRDRDPYRIWVSEVMLQQTQVVTVIPFFERFLERFPTFVALAQADLQEVLRLWEGMGYYRRARDLHRGARQMLARHGPTLPSDPAAWQDVPGVGRYIRGAILSQAFELPLPIVEANSLRLLCRLAGYRECPRSGPGQRWLWQTAEALLPSTRRGDFNQALMELGALVCLPTQPRCRECPLRRHCEAARTDQQETIPLRARPPEWREVREVAVVVRQGPHVLLTQRPAHGRWAEMWEFPHREVHVSGALDEAARQALAELTGLDAALGAELTTIRHVVTRHRIEMTCFEAHYRSGEFVSSFYPKAEWVHIAALGKHPISVPQRKLARGLATGQLQRGLFGSALPAPEPSPGPRGIADGSGKPARRGDTSRKHEEDGPLPRG
jgi:A/G-specific adenine glycosylase